MATTPQTVGRGGHSWLLPNQWVMHPSLDLRGDKELPAPCPETRTKGFLHMSKARRLDLDHAKCFPLRENPLVLSHHCRGVMYSRPKGITLDSSCFLKLLDSEWPAFSYTLDWHEDWLYLSREHTCLHRGRFPRQDKRFSVLEKHTFLALSLIPELFHVFQLFLSTATTPHRWMRGWPRKECWWKTPLKIIFREQNVQSRSHSQCRQSDPSRADSACFTPSQTTHKLGISPLVWCSMGREEHTICNVIWFPPYFPLSLLRHTGLSMLLEF